MRVTDEQSARIVIFVCLSAYNSMYVNSPCLYYFVIVVVGVVGWLCSDLFIFSFLPVSGFCDHRFGQDPIISVL